MQLERTKTFSPVTATAWALGMSWSGGHISALVALEELKWLNTALLPVAGAQDAQLKGICAGHRDLAAGLLTRHGISVLARPKHTHPNARKAEHWPHH